jgi:hypothetical protein
MPVIGFLSSGSQQFDEFRLTGLRQGLMKAAMLRGEISPSNTAGQIIRWIGSQR